MARLRGTLGTDATFLIPPEATWPTGTPLDPETGRPYDPFLEPENPEEPTEVTVRVSFVHRPIDQTDPAGSPIGAIDRGNAAVILTPAEHELVAHATRVR